MTTATTTIEPLPWEHDREEYWRRGGSASLTVFSPRGIKYNVHEPKPERQIRWAELTAEGVRVAIHFDSGLDPSAALAEVDALIEGLHAFRHAIVEKAGPA